MPFFLVTTTGFLTTFQLFLDLYVLFAFKFPIRFFLPENMSFHRKKQTAQDRASSGPLFPIVSLQLDLILWTNESHLASPYSSLFIYSFAHVLGLWKLEPRERKTFYTFPQLRMTSLFLFLCHLQKTRSPAAYTSQGVPPTPSTLLKSRGMSFGWSSDCNTISQLLQLESYYLVFG